MSLKQELVARLESLMKDQDVSAIMDGIEALEIAYKKAAQAHEKELEAAFIAGGDAVEDFEYTPDNEDHRFKELINVYNGRLEKYEQQKKEQEASNLEVKRGIIEELKKLIAEEENIGKAFNRFNELQEKWRTAGNVYTGKYKSLQSEYNHQIDRFYYTIDIYKALKDNDLQHNLDTKKELIIKMQDLLAQENIKETEKLVKAYEHEWTETGPVPKDEWEEIRDLFWTTTSHVYKRIKFHYDELRAQQQEHKKVKQKLVDQAEQLSKLELKGHKKWEEKTKQLLDLQSEWKESGFAGRAEENQLWEAFRASFNTFFGRKRDFYKELKKDNDAHKNIKEKLIEKVESLKDNTDWKQTTKDIIQLQKQWKDVGAAHPREEQKLWNRFRAACDHFFNAKKEFFDTLDDRQQENLKQKNELIQKVESFSLSGDNGKDLEALRQFSDEWHQLGHVPHKDADRVNSAYKKALDAQYDKLKLDRSEKQTIRFKNRIEGLSQGQNGNRAIDKEKTQLQNTLKKLEATLQQYENNLSFFSSSSKDNPLLKLAQENIEKTKAEAELVRKQLGMLKKAKQEAGKQA